MPPHMPLSVKINWIDFFLEIILIMSAVINFIVYVETIDQSCADRFFFFFIFYRSRHRPVLCENVNMTTLHEKSCSILLFSDYNNIIIGFLIYTSMYDSVLDRSDIFEYTYLCYTVVMLFLNSKRIIK